MVQLGHASARRRGQPMEGFQVLTESLFNKVKLEFKENIQDFVFKIVFRTCTV